MATITKKDIIEMIAKRTKTHRNMVRDILQSTLDTLVNQLAAGHRVEFRDFGVFEIRVRAPRTAQNPRTLETVQVERRRAVRFKAGRLMKERVRGTAASPQPELKLTNGKLTKRRVGATADRAGRIGKLKSASNPLPTPT